MNRARKSGGAGSGEVKNSLLPKMGTGKGMAKPIKNSIAVRPGANSASKVGNSLALCGPGMKKKGY